MLVVFSLGCSVTETKLLPLLHKFSSQKHNWKQLESAEIAPTVELQMTLSGLKTQHLKFKAKSLHPIPARCFSMSDHWAEHTLHKDPEFSSSGFHLLQMLFSPPARRQDMEGHLEGKPFNKFLYSKACFLNLSSLLVKHVII